jgi:hypothetical protein
MPEEIGDGGRVVGVNPRPGGDLRGREGAPCAGRDALDAAQTFQPPAALGVGELPGVRAEKLEHVS